MAMYLGEIELDQKNSELLMAVLVLQLYKEKLAANEVFSDFYKNLTGVEYFKNGSFFAYCFGYPYVESATEGKKLFERYFGILFDDDDLAKAVESDETITLDEKEEEETENELSHRLTSIIREHFILQTALYFFLKNDPG
ncbi:hypothetical protein HDU92_005128 [Lobulomyces angularis]|nr:hypothetical protein HDU92_005128 [Lobulomyces angularis]